MEALSRQEYPAMLARLQPAAAVSKLNERVKKIGKVNTEIADWLQERRKVEEAYIAGLRKLSKRPLQEVGGDLGIFDASWKRILSSTETIASSHATLSQRIDKDVEQPLRAFATNNREMSAMTTIQGNLAAMAKELEEAQEKSDKLSKKGGKASTQKMDSATSKLQSASQQWDSQAPFIFETLQALDETRLNHLRDVLTQYETHEADQIERNRVTVEQTLGFLLEIDTSQEIRTWSQAVVEGKPLTQRRGRQLSNSGASNARLGSAGSNAGFPPPTAAPQSAHTDDTSVHSGRRESSGESKLKSRFGTMLGRRRQSIHGGFARAPSPSKGFVPFGRNSASREGRPIPSPRASSTNLRETARENRLSSLAESPTATGPTSPNGNINGTNGEPSLISDTIPDRLPSNVPNGTATEGVQDLSDVQPPPGPPPSHLKPAAEARRDSEGFTVPAAMNDPISQAQQEAQEGEQPQFKLDIRNEPIPEQDADAQAALSNVANTLRSAQAVTPNRKSATVRGRRDVRNTVYVPAGNSLEAGGLEHPLPPSPGMIAGRAAALAALSSVESAAPTASDTTSIRSGHSLTNNIVVKHAEMHNPGLNASIIETVSATFENGDIKTSKINGEIALVYNNTGLEELPSSANETVRINNFPNLEAIGPNRTFIHPVSGEKSDEYTIDLASISPKSVVGFTYKVHIDEVNLTSQGPLLIKPAWKPQGDKLGLVIEYCLNPAYSSEPVSFYNLALVAMYGGARAMGCQTKPSGTHLKERSLVYWRLGDMTLTNEWHKVICRLTGAEDAMPEPGHIEARWEIHGSAAGISLSRLEPGKGKERAASDDPFADESIVSPTTLPPPGNWLEIETSKKLVSGKYEARQVLA